MDDMIPDEEIVCTMAHIRDAKLCSRGARHWFEKYGLDYNDFLTNGLSADRALATGDAFGQRVVAAARKEAEDGRRRRG